MSNATVTIERRSNQELVEATLLQGMVPNDLLVVESEWAAERSRIMQQVLLAGLPHDKRPESLHWDWRSKAPLLKSLAATCSGLAYDQQFQGVMLTQSAPHQAKLPEDKGKPLVYIDFLEAAPWNWVIPGINQLGKYRMIGSVLLWSAVKQSWEEGFHGRVGLHALPLACGFYERLGMTPLGKDIHKENLDYFELPRQTAQQWLDEGGGA